MKRLFDLAASFTGIILLIPFLILISLLVALSSGFPVLFFQKRVGKDGIDFSLLKFRTMKNGSDKFGSLTVGKKDPRITGIGRFLRKYKLDELPQLFNVLTGDMSLVGPRPELRKYVSMYTAEQKTVLSVLPGITDYASIEYSNENELIALASDPERYYIDQVMPAKLKLNLKYIDQQSLVVDLKIVLKTIGKIFS